ncbi:hypothetical protein [Streptomyces axinellae]|uniref:Cytochrome P450 n=1 Tax=Streptomyces axinellae TaxID=552788 RepID=A0ABN3PZL2_9ACTN
MTSPRHSTTTSAPAGCPAHQDAGADAGADASAGAEAVALMGPRFRNNGRSRLYRDLRAEHGRIAPVTLPGEVPAWLVLGYRELHQVTTDSGLFSRDSALWDQWPRIPADWPLRPMIGKQASVLYTVGERRRHRTGRSRRPRRQGRSSRQGRRSESGVRLPAAHGRHRQPAGHRHGPDPAAAHPL